MKGRQIANEVDRIGLRLQLRERHAEAGDIVLLYGDESEALTHPYLARAWAKPVVLVEDNGPIHTSKASLAALAARAHWLTVEWLPKYSPELNDIEVVWHDLKAFHLAHQTFTDTAALDQAIHTAVHDLNLERMVDPLAEPRISA